MTAEELIIEHFEGTLSLEQEGELTQVLAASPEARSMYDRYLRVDDVLAGDAVATAPSSALDERVVAAALGAIGGTIGGSSAAGWLSGKVAAVISVVAVGGLSVILLTNNDPEPIKTPVTAPAKPAPAAAPAPTTPIPAPAVEAQVEPEVKAPATTPSVTRRPSSTTSAEAPATRRPKATPPAATSGKPKLNLPKDQKTTIENPTVIDPNKK